jgi:hypothetical protein
MLVEIRDENDLTIYMSFLIGTLNPNAVSEMGISWTPQYVGEYEVRSFAITNFTKPEILSLQAVTRVTVS